MKLTRLQAILGWIFVFMFTLSANGLEYSKLDPRLKMLEQNPEMIRLYKTHQKGLQKSNFDQNINILLKTNADIEYLEQLGVKVYTVIGDIATANVPVSSLGYLADDPMIDYLEAPKKMNLHTDIAIPEIGALSVYQNYGVSGEGVIIGIIDTGIDWRHDDFRNDDGTTRIKYLLDFSFPGDTNGDEILDGPDQFGGTLYTEQEINNALFGSGIVNSDDVVGHGTHVAGVAAGNGRASGNGLPSGQYVGVAPEADLIIVKATRVQGSQSFYGDDYVNALKFIDDMASSLAQPYVVNMSLGSNDGAHDGTSLSEQAIDELVGSDIPGKVVVVSAGNDGENDIHASGTFTNSNNSYEVSFQIDEYDENSGNYDDYVLFETWYDGTSNVSVSIETPDGTGYGPVSRGTEYSRNTSDGAVYIDNASGGKNPLNQDYQLIIQVFDFESAKPPTAGEWKIILTSTSGRFDLWLSTSTMSASLTSHVDPSMLIANPATAFNSIAVGSYVTKNRWTDLDGKTISPVPLPTLYSASAFSSSGPTRDLRTKPEISAPGEWIAASFSIDAPPSGSYTMFNTGNEGIPNGFITPDGKHALAQGTSFSAPVVSGLIALMLENYPDLDSEEIKTAIISTAKTDEFTTSVNKWGYGKLDGFKAMQFIAGDLVTDDMSINILQNPALTQYIDIYILTETEFETNPTATISEGNGDNSSISFSQLESMIYKGEYEFSSSGTASLVVTTKIPGEAQKTTTKYFGVQILKAESNGILKYNEIELQISNNNIQDDLFFTFIPESKLTHNTGTTQYGSSYKIGPETINTSMNMYIGFDLVSLNLSNNDVNKLGIYKYIDDKWIKLENSSLVNEYKIMVPVNELGTFGLFYDPNSITDSRKPNQFALYKNYPNPFNAHTTIQYQLPNDTDVKIRVFNINGQEIRTLYNGIQKAGVHIVRWDGLDNGSNAVSSGIYLYKIESEAFTSSKKMLYLK